MLMMGEIVQYLRSRRTDLERKVGLRTSPDVACCSRHCILRPCSALRESPCLHPPHSQGTACQSCACGVVGAHARPNHAMWETQVSGAQGAHMEVLLVDNLVARLREIIVCDWHTRRPVSGMCAAKFGYQLLPPFVQNYCGQDSKAYVLALLGCNTHL